MSLIATRRKLKYLLPLVWVFIAIFILGAFFTFNFNPTGTADSPDQALLARVDGQEIRMAQFQQIMDLYRDQFRNFAPPGQAFSVQQQAEIPGYAYSAILREYSQAAAAEANGISVSPDDARAEIRRRADEILKEKAAGSTPQELEEYRRVLIANMPADVERRNLLAQRLRDKLNQEARPVEVRVAHILIKVSDKRSQSAAEKLAQDLTRRARTGADFSKLAQQYSEDEGSKVMGGVVGWASAMPPQPSADPKAKPNPNDATNFVPEFTAAALRLQPNQVSDPVRSTFGYHVLKVLEERPYEPKTAEAKKDPKKRAEAIDEYKQAVGSQIFSGLTSEYERRLKVEPVSAWLRGHLLEQQMTSMPEPGTDPAKVGEGQVQKRIAVIAAYEEAFRAGEPAAGSGLAYKLSQLYQQTASDYEQAKQPQQAKAEYEKALTFLEDWATRSGDAELFFQKGQVLEKLKRKTDALAAYQKAMEYANNDTAMLGRLADAFKNVGRKDLAQQARAKQSQELARQAAERKQQEAEMKRRAAEDAKRRAAEEAKKKAQAATPPQPAKPGSAGNGPTGSDPGKGKRKPEASHNAPATP
jgi:parvulin-like peptidyl-prolyl isomerase